VDRLSHGRIELLVRFAGRALQVATLCLVLDLGGIGNLTRGDLPQGHDDIFVLG
jgi:hypothetical protein